MRVFLTAAGCPESSLSFQERAALVQICRVELGQLDQPVMIVKRYAAIPEGHHFALAQLAQDAVHVDGTQAQGIGQVILCERTSESFPAPQADERQSR